MFHVFFLSFSAYPGGLVFIILGTSERFVDAQ